MCKAPGSWVNIGFCSLLSRRHNPDSAAACFKLASMSVSALPRSSPESQGVDPAGILAFLDTLESAPDIEMHSLMIIRHGQVVAEGWWSPYLPEQPHLLYSLSKSFTSTAAAFAVAEGLLDLDATVLSYFPELDSEITDRRSRSILVRHVAAMASGHLEETDRAGKGPRSSRTRTRLPAHPARSGARQRIRLQPAVYVHARSDRAAPDRPDLDRVPAPPIVRPAGHRSSRLAAAPQPVATSGGRDSTQPPTRSLGSGCCTCKRGVWNGQRLLSEEWVAEATRVQVRTPNEPNPDWRRGYGFQFWMSRYGYRGDGAYGQFCLVLPEQDAIIATTAETENMQGILDAVWTHLLPSMTATTVGPSPVAEQLAARLDRLQLAAFQAKPAPDSSVAAWAESSFLPVGGVCQAQRDPRGRAAPPTRRAVAADPGGG